MNFDENIFFFTLFFPLLQMKSVVILLIAIYAIICSATVHPTAFNPVFEYDVPVASQPIVYPARPAYVQSYGYSSPAVSHSYSHSQTHPAAYVKPVSYFSVFHLI